MTRRKRHLHNPAITDEVIAGFVDRFCHWKHCRHAPQRLAFRIIETLFNERLMQGIGEQQQPPGQWAKREKRK